MIMLFKDLEKMCKTDHVLGKKEVTTHFQVLRSYKNSAADWGLQKHTPPKGQGTWEIYTPTPSSHWLKAVYCVRGWRGIDYQHFLSGL